MIPASVLCPIKVSHGTLSVKPYWPETDEFLCDGLNGSPGRLLLLVIRFMADLLRKYRGSVVIMVGRGGA